MFWLLGPSISTPQANPIQFTHQTFLFIFGRIERKVQVRQLIHKESKEATKSQGTMC